MAFNQVTCPTRYAAGYSEAAFTRVEVGMALHTVEQSLGVPLLGITNDYLKAWFYADRNGPTNSYRRHFGSYAFRMLIFTNDAVYMKVTERRKV